MLYLLKYESTEYRFDFFSAELALFAGNSPYILMYKSVSASQPCGWPLMVVFWGDQAAPKATVAVAAGTVRATTLPSDTTTRRAGRRRSASIGVAQS